MANGTLVRRLQVAARSIVGSLAFRVISFSTLWAIVALVVITTAISTFYRQASERNFDSLLAAHLFNLIGAVTVDREGNLIGAPEFGDIRYSQPFSGWYWAVEPLGSEPTEPLRSPSMTSAIPGPRAEAIPFDRDFQRTYVVGGPGGEQVRVFESEFLLGSTNRVARFRLMGNETEFRNDVGGFDRLLWSYLSVFGLGMIAINAVAILFGLRPLDRVRKAVGRVREGQADRLDGLFPFEIEPLAREMNALIDNNRRIVERSRTQVGNLAHSLKTPLAVIQNEGSSIGGSRGKLIVEQSDAMRMQIDHYLQRARIAAQSNSFMFRTDAVRILDRMVRVVGKLSPDKAIELEIGDSAPLFAGEKEDLEEIVGNLLENAMKWSRSQTRVRIEERAAGRFAIVVDDDGPGIPEAQAEDAIKRGRRLDETKPGTGLGLSIVTELVSEYGGILQLGRSSLGGLQAVVELPLAA